MLRQLASRASAAAAACSDCRCIVSAAAASYAAPHVSPPRPRRRHPVNVNARHHSTSGSCSADIRDAFNAHTASTSHGAPRRPGRFGYAALQEPGDFLAVARRTQVRARAIVQRILHYDAKRGTLHDGQLQSDNATQDLLVQVKQVDRLSDLLCGVIDLAEVVRNLDPDPEWIAYADQAYQELSYYMNELNTNVGLYQALKRVHDPVAARSAHTGSTTRGQILAGSSSHQGNDTLFAALSVSKHFLDDFEKSGIHLPSRQRRRFVELSDEILALGRDFTAPETGEQTGSSNGAGGGGGVAISLKEIEEWSPRAAEMIVQQQRHALSHSQRGDSSKLVLQIDPSSAEGQAIRREHPSEDVRRRFYLAGYSEANQRDRLSVLEELLKKRLHLANLVGRDSWAHVALGDKMAAHPDHVDSFLGSLSDKVRPAALRDVKSLANAKAIHLSATSTAAQADIQAWDRDYYWVRAMSSPQNGMTAASQSGLSSFFSLGHCISGLSSLFTRLYGIRFEVESLSQATNEVWLPEDVRKISVYDETEGRIGEIYCDLFAREGKPPGAAHFTVRCARRVDDDQTEGDLGFLQEAQQSNPDVQIDVNDPSLPLSSPATEYRGRDGKHQLPIVVLTCDFERPSRNTPTLLSWQEVETLFHEMGHAMHSMIGRTDYHNVAGTRCATDLVELPSILMEHFLSSPDVLALFAQHWKTGHPLPLDQLRAVQRSIKGFTALETNAQITMAIADQAYHSDRVCASHWSSTQVWYDTQRQFGVIPAAPGVAWQTNFTHLFGYGATYYSYLFDRAIASRVFARLFKEDPLSREAGEKYKAELLRHGGGKEPWACVAAVLDEAEVAQGDRRAMDIVGSWSVEQ